MLKHKRVVLFIGVVIGVLLILTAEHVNYVTSTDDFCSNSCHSMNKYIANDEVYVSSKHRTSDSGIMVSCADCHIPKPLLLAMWVHVKGGVNDSISELRNDFTNPAVWESLKPQLAKQVREQMLANDSRACRNCHTMSKIAVSSLEGQRAHAQSFFNKETCIQCHYNLVHSPVEPHEGFAKK
ncbi:NapC/NirT family cytochrome c [Zooshikella marina]|uniref:NapC/NirT family cytochrome c n=1 Tax=Zooshikella ganghwensis TaxID=202772 RepID=UPI001BAF8CA6|nr:NapC/NirT family cytochrome c [Zooshikella ganghwensis]MBU2708078.1 NapC/NirT family cytochrome c [Zooshikella ganghwensis]